MWRVRDPAIGATLAALAMAGPQAFAQSAPASAPAPEAAAQQSDEEADSGLEEIVVMDRKTYAQQVGAVVGNIEPELQLSPADIQSYGVSTVSDLVAELAPETRSERGRGGESPVFLLNGRRISSLNEFLTLPTEAILRVDILPEEGALKYGYTADQRVINIVLRRRFHAVAGELAGGGPTEGGEVTGKAEADQLRIRRDNRLNLDLKYLGSSGLTEASRGIIQPNPSAMRGADRSLTPATQALSANAVLARPILGGINATGNATLTANTSNSRQGYPSSAASGPASGSVRRYVKNWSSQLGSTLNKDQGEWRFSLTDGYDHDDSQTDTDTLSSAGPAGGNPLVAQSDARSITDSGNVQFLANGPVFDAPAGPLYVSAKAGDVQSRLSASSMRGGSAVSAAVNRNDANAQINIDLPLASRRNSVMPFAGELSLSANGAIEQLSDLGTLASYGYGLNWTPVPGYAFAIWHTNDQAAPTIQQQGAPAVFTRGVRVFDYVTGRTVDVTQITGGSPGLRTDARDVLKVGLTVKPFEAHDLTFIGNYVKIRSDHPIQVLPAATPAVQAAFPQRFVRDSAGQIIEEDLRPVNIARSDRSELRWGFNYSQRIGQTPAQAGREPSRAVLQSYRDKSVGAGEGVGAKTASASTSPESAHAINASNDFGSRRDVGTRASGARFEFAIYHTLYLTDREQLTPGGPVLDLLNGAAASNTGGQYRNEIEAKLGASLKGFGVRLSADWRERTSVQGGHASPAGDLRFSGITKINLRLFANFGQQKDLVMRLPWLRGVRVSVYVNNLLDERIQVRDVNNATLTAYQPGYIDPRGRTVMLTARKLFF